MESRIYNVNLQSGYNTLTYIGISQYDAGVPLQFNVYDGATAASFPVGTTAKIQGVRPSGVGFNIDCTLTDNVVTVDSSTDMTGEAGKFPVEIRFESSGVDVGTVNFIFMIEKAPHPDGTIDADITRQASFIERLEALEDDKVPYPATDKYGTAGQVLKTLGDGTTEWTNVSSGQGVSDDLKAALLQIAQKVVYIDEHGQDYYDDLYDALYPPAPPATLVSISAVYTQSGIVYDSDSLDSLKSDLVVTAHYDNGTTLPVADSAYTLSGTLTVGTSTITVAYSGKTTVFNVTVTKGIDYTEDALANATWNSGKAYNQITGVIEDTSGSYATDKFDVQDLTYKVINNDTTHNTTFRIFMWDANGVYLGTKQYSEARFQFKPGYKYAIEVRNASTFDPTTITMLPVDKRATAVEEFEIDLASIANNVVKANGYYEVNVKSQMNAVGVTNQNYTDTINRQSIFGMIGEAVNTNNFPFKTPIRIGTFHYSSNMLLSIYIEGITVSDANLQSVKDYLVNNNVKITYNY